MGCLFLALLVPTLDRTRRRMRKAHPSAAKRRQVRPSRGLYGLPLFGADGPNREPDPATAVRRARRGALALSASCAVLPGIWQQKGGFSHRMREPFAAKGRSVRRATGAAI